MPFWRRNLIRGFPTLSNFSAETVSSAAAPTLPSSRAGGQDYVSYTLTPSNYMYIHKASWSWIGGLGGGRDFYRDFYKDYSNNYVLGDFRQILVKEKYLIEIN